MNQRRFSAFCKRECEVIASALSAFYAKTTDESEEILAEKLRKEVGIEIYVPQENQDAMEKK